MKRALITGITGQDGRHLAQSLAAKGYQVFGLIRGQGNPKAEIVQRETPSLELVDGDLRDLSSLIAAVDFVQPDEVYNLGAISFVHLSFTQPELTAEITGLGVLRMLEAVRMVGGGDDLNRLYQPAAAEMFGQVRETPQSELTPFPLRSPDGGAKALWPHMPDNYRQAVEALDRYFMYCGGIVQGDVLVKMCDDLATLFEEAAANDTPIRDIVGDDPVSFAQTFLANYTDGGWQRKERARLVEAIDRAAQA